MEVDENPPGKRNVGSLSPEHHAKMNQQYPQKAKFNHLKHNNDMTENNDTPLYENELASHLSHSQTPSQPNESDAEMQHNRLDEVGEGQ